MNDENLEMYLYQQFNAVLDSDLDTEEKQQKLGQLFLNASNSISAIYLVNHEDEAKEMLKMAVGEQKADINFKSLLKNEWYIYTNIAIWIDFLHSVFNEIQPNHPQYDFFSQVMDSISGIELQLGINQDHLVS